MVLEKRGRPTSGPALASACVANQLSQPQGEGPEVGRKTQRHFVLLSLDKETLGTSAVAVISLGIVQGFLGPAYNSVLYQAYRPLPTTLI